MPPKKKSDPVSGQRSIAAFFASKPKQSQSSVAAVALSPAKLLKPEAAEDVGSAKDSAAAAAGPAPALPQQAARAPAGKTAAGATAGAAKPKPKSGKAKVPAAAATGEPGGQAAVGRSVKVFWEAEQAWFTGDVEEYSESSGKYRVLYDDGDEEWADLAGERFEWVQRCTGGKAGKAPGKTVGKAAGRKRKVRAVVDSDSEGVVGGDADEASGSEYAASEADSSEDEEASLASESDEEMGEVDSDDDNDLSDASPAGRSKKKGGTAAGAAKSSGGSRKLSGRGGGGGGGAKAAKAANAANAAATPAALSNGSVGLTPGSIPGATLLASSAGPAGAYGSAMRTAGTAAKPPRPSAAAAAARTPGTAGTTGSLARVLAGTPMTGGTVAGGETPGTASAFRAHTEAFPFLHPDRIRDAAKRRPDDPDYDARTLLIPSDWYKNAKVSPGQQQWWEFKCRHFDCILLFKMGKFYELFEMDAHVAVECLGLSYMKGEKPHVGFPEAAYHSMAERLARAGHKVVVIEQTETPDMLKIRNEERASKGLKKETVVRREKVAVLTQGTLTDQEMLTAQPEASYLLTLAELPVPDALMSASEHAGAPPCVWVGACAVDVATGQMLLGQWLDDEMRSQLRAVLTAVQPMELVLPRGGVSLESRKVARAILRAPRIEEIPLGSEDGEFWDAHTVWRQLESGSYFPNGATLPPVLAAVREGGDAQAAAAHALGGCLSHLRDVLLDKSVLAAGRVELLAETFGIGAGLAGGGSGEVGATAGPQHMALDGAALENLEVLENSEGGTQGTLLSALNNCVTPVGRRRMRQWLCRPLYRVPDITARQDAVADLMGAGEEAAANARTLFKSVADLERSLARINSAGAGVGSARDAPHVILYEDVAKRRVQAYAAALHGLSQIQTAAEGFQAVRENLSSSLLQRLVTPGELFPDMADALREMQDATDWEEAKSSGRIDPAQGVDEAYDAALECIQEAEQALKDYLQEARRAVGAGVKVSYVSLNKDSHVLEVPEGAKVPANWEPCAGKKGYKRYMSVRLIELVKARDAAYDAKERAQGEILQGMMRKFASRRALWEAAVECMAQLDALMSLAVAAACGSGTMCRPVLLPWNPAEGGAPVFHARGLRHPAGVSGRDGTFVPNDIQLGGQAEPFIVLTGPNMGGKSTLMRQVCLASLMAQVGAWVPADEVQLTPADAAFVRMGARDRIMLGQSTFLVELSETSAALHRATPASLVILDELGRGTSTGDGAAIAAAVLDHLTTRVGCRGMFATHYHHISDSHAADPRVALKHMGCAVTPPSDPEGVEEVTFLYKLTDGACPKSYGTNVARLAGLPDAVVRRAAAKAAESEAARQAAGGGGTGNPSQNKDRQQQAGVEDGSSAGAAPTEQLPGTPAAAAELLRRVRVACKTAATGGCGDAEAAGAVLALQREVRKLLRLE